MILKAMMKLVRLPDPLADGSGNLTMMKPAHLIVKVEVGKSPL